MRRETALAGAAAAVVVAVGVVGFGLGRIFTGSPEVAVVPPPVQAQTAQAKKDEPDLPTGSISARGSIASAPAVAPAAPRQVAQAAAAPGRASIAAAPRQECSNPDALGVTRVVEIDTTGGPGFGLEQFKAHDFLNEKEIVLTFDDGPWPVNTPAVLKALTAQCTKATFFPVGKHSLWHPEILRQVAAAGHTIGSHTWSHANLMKLGPDQAKEEFEKGVSAVRSALGTQGAPFFRFPGLRHPPEMVAYLGERNFGIFSIDVDSFDFRTSKPEKVIETVMTKLQKRGKGVVLLHDFQKSTALALPELLARLKAEGFKVVHLKAKEPATTLQQYDEALQKDAGPTMVSARSTSSVVRTIPD